MNDSEEAAKAAREASHSLQSARESDKSNALRAIHASLQSSKEFILAANAKDLALAKEGSLSESLVKRLDLNLSGKWESLLEGILQVEALDDPTGKVQLATRLDEGLDLYRVSCPIGVLLIIFEARPEVVVQISCLAIKSGVCLNGCLCVEWTDWSRTGNAVVLKGGKEATHSNAALFSAISSALLSLSPSHNIPQASVQLVETRDEISTLLKLDAYIDLVSPRGSKSLVQHIKEITRIPVMGHADGLCSIYVDESADEEKVVPLIVDSNVHWVNYCKITLS